ncbi:MAG: VOC family protein [Acidobacteriota bacterium]
MKIETTLRVARPTDHLDEVVRFYTDGVGLARLGAFEDHDGFDGVMLGVPGAAYHLEFTRKRRHVTGRAPTGNNLLVFYLPDKQQWQDAVNRMISAHGSLRPPREDSSCLAVHAGGTLQPQRP